MSSARNGGSCQKKSELFCHPVSFVIYKKSHWVKFYKNCSILLAIRYLTQVHLFKLKIKEVTGFRV